MKKRIISILLCTVMLLCAIPFSASGAESAESVVFKGDALLSAVTNASQTAVKNNRKFEVVNGNLKYTRLQEDGNLVNFDLNFGASYVGEYKYVGLKYRIDLSDVASARNYSVTKVCVDGNNNDADGLAINTGNELKCATGVVGWGLGTGKEAWTRLCVMGNGTKTDGTVVEDGKFTPVNFVLVIEELVLFKSEDDASQYYKTAGFGKGAFCLGVQTKGQDARVLAVIDELTASNVGFNVVVSSTGGTKTFTVTTETVYTSVLVAGEAVTAYNSGGSYIFALVIEGIPVGEATFTVTPTVDGVAGEPVTMTATMTAAAKS